MKKEKLKTVGAGPVSAQKGITLIALVITIVLMLILASITVNVVINGGLFEYAGSAKNSTEIASEKETLQKATIIAESTSKTGRVTVEEMQKAINNIAEENIATAMDNGDTIVVKFNNSNRYYEINNKGNVEGPKELVQDENAGDITKGGTCDGSETNPFQITCIEDLVAFSIMTNGGNSTLGLSSNQFAGQYVELTRTLDFKSMFSYYDYTTTIYGDLNTDGIIEDIRTELTKTDDGCIGFKRIGSFSGNFNGQENPINNIYQNFTDMSGGLFYENYGEISNVILSGEIKSTEEVGGITYRNNNLIYNCTNYADLICEASGGYLGAGGIAAVSSGTIDQCSNFGDIISDVNLGGIVGYNISNSKIINCLNSGDLIGKGNGFSNGYVGGISGLNRYNTKIYNCYNTGELEAVSSKGSIIGLNWEWECKIKNVYSATVLNIDGGKYVGTTTKENYFYIGMEEKYTKEYMKTQSFVDELNNYIDNNSGETEGWLKWKIGADGWPTFE